MTELKEDAMTKKFNEAIEKLKSIFTVSQAMAKNSFYSTFPIKDKTDNPDLPPDHKYPEQPPAGELLPWQQSLLNDYDQRRFLELIERYNHKLSGVWDKDFTINGERLLEIISLGWGAIFSLDRSAAQLKAKDELLFAYESVRAPKQPPAGECTKEIRQWIKDRHYLDNVHSLPDFILLANRLLDTCKYLDRSESSRKELLKKADNFCKAWNNHASEVELHKAYFECEAAIKANKEGGE